MVRKIVMIGLVLGLGFACAPTTETPMVSMDDGSVNGEVYGIINVEPNSGPENTPVIITITFSTGASRVDGILIGDYGSSCNLVRTWSDVFHKASSSKWVCSNTLVLSGRNGVAGFFAYDDSGTIIASGNVDINGGCSAQTTARAVSDNGVFEQTE